MADKENRDVFGCSIYCEPVAEYFGNLMAADEGFAARSRGLADAVVSAAEGRILETLTRAVNARKAVEIGTAAGYSGHWIARGLSEGGRLYTLEKDQTLAASAKDCFERSSLLRKVTVLEGPAADNLKTLAKLAPFDLCFMDADEENYPLYLRWAAANLRPGGLAAANGVFLKGKIRLEGGDPAENARARAMREFFHILFDADRFVAASVLPTGEGMAVGVKS